jgi:hypothetical protein
VDRDGRLAELVPDPVDVARAALARVTGPEVQLDVGPSVHEEVLSDAALRAAEPYAGDVVVVKARSLPRHPREHPRVDVLVLVDQLVAPLVAVDADERLPDLRSLEDVDGELLELLGRQDSVAREEITQ